MDDAAVMAAKAQVEGLLEQARADLDSDDSPRLVWRVLERELGAVIDGLARKLTAVRPVVDAEAYAVLDHVEKLASRALSSDRSDFKFYLDAIRKEVEALRARGMQPEGHPQAHEQAREVLRLVGIFSAGCGNTAPLGKPPEECPGCAADFVARVRKAAAAAWERERPETRGGSGALRPRGRGRERHPPRSAHGARRGVELRSADALAGDIVGALEVSRASDAHAEGASPDRAAAKPSRE